MITFFHIFLDINLIYKTIHLSKIALQLCITITMRYRTFADKYFKYSTTKKKKEKLNKNKNIGPQIPRKPMQNTQNIFFYYALYANDILCLQKKNENKGSRIYGK